MIPHNACACIVALLTTCSSHLCVLNERLIEALRYGLERSPALRELVTAIDVADRRVYINEGPCGEGEFRSCVHPIAGSRNLQILVTPRVPVTDVVRQLAHEFQHVLEINAETTSTGASALRDVYERIGFRSCTDRGDCYETAKALEVEALVNREVTSRRSARLTDTYFGEWRLDIDKSSFPSCPPSSGRRFDRDQRHGLASTVVEFVDCVGVDHRDAFVYKADGRDYMVTGDRSRTIAVAIVDAGTSAFLIKERGTVITCGKRSISADGKTMTVERWSFAGGAASRTALEFWKRVD